MRKQSIALAVACATLAAPAAAQAHHHHHRTTGAKLTFSHPKHKAQKTTLNAPSPQEFTVGMGNVQTLGCDNLPLDGTSFVRVIAGFHDPVDRLLPCAEAAHAAGLRVMLVVQWGNGWTVAQIRQRFAEALSAYQPIQPFAVGVGNEQEGPWDDGPQESGAQYAAIWRTVEPMVAAAFPHAIRVAGEISPWGNHFMLDALQAGLPGAQALAVHAYPAASNPEGYTTAQFAQYAHEYGLPAWADEGLCGPHGWVGYGCTTADEFKHDGYSLAAEWYDATQASAPAAPSIPY
jgi:hypothetical protein